MSKFEVRQYVRREFNEIIRRNLYGALDVASPGHLRGIDVMNEDEVVHKLTRCAFIQKGSYGTLPCYTNPTSFYERLTVAKFFAPIPMPSPGDKLAVGLYIPSKIRGNIRPAKVVFVSNNANDLAKVSLPPGTYFLKSNAGSGSVRKLKFPLDSKIRESLIAECTKWLGASHGIKAGEWWYELIGNKIFIEENVGPEDTDTVDWKVHVGGSRVLAVQVDLDRTSGHRQLIFDENFQAEEEQLFFRNDGSIDKPMNFDLLLYAAREIGKQFEYARVDFYLSEDSVFLGEITLCPMGGLKVPKSQDLNKTLGYRWGEFIQRPSATAT